MTGPASLCVPPRALVSALLASLLSAPAAAQSNAVEVARRIPFLEAGGEVDPEWRVYARSAGDDKAPLAALTTALDALYEAGIRRTSNVSFLFDGEKEAGSGHLDE